MTLFMAVQVTIESLVVLVMMFLFTAGMQVLTGFTISAMAMIRLTYPIWVFTRFLISRLAKVVSLQ